MREKLLTLKRELKKADAGALSLYIVSMFTLIFYLHHGKPGKAWDFFSGPMQSLSPEHATLAEFMYSHLSAFVVLFTIPFLFGKYALKMSASDMGLGFRRCKTEMILVAVFIAVMIPLVYVFSQTDSFAATYPKAKIIKNNATLFFLYQFIYLIKWFSWEFFFRGFMLFALAKKYGTSAILFAAMPFVIAHLGKPEAEVYGAVVAGLVLGAMSYSGKSIYPTILLHFAVAFCMDFFSSTWWRF